MFMITPTHSSAPRLPWRGTADPAPRTSERGLRADLIERGVRADRTRRESGRGPVVALAFSVALHAAGFAALALRVVKDAEPASARSVLVRLVLPPGRLVPAPEGDGPLPPRTVVSAGSRLHPSGCRGTVYTGIGATVNRAGFVIELAPGGPAQRAGVLAGDAILNLDDLPIDTFPAGQRVGLRLLRDGAEASTVVHIGAICNEPDAPVA